MPDVVVFGAFVVAVIAFANAIAYVRDLRRECLMIRNHYEREIAHLRAITEAQRRVMDDACEESGERPTMKGKLQ